MTADLAAQIDAALQQAHDLCGADATVEHPGGAVDEVTVLISEMPAGRVQARYGRDDVRVADCEFRRAALSAVPARDARVTLADGAQAGVWTVLGTEREDDAVVVVRVRRSIKADAVAAGAKAMRR